MPHELTVKATIPQNPNMSHHQATPAEGEKVAAQDYKRREKQYKADMKQLNAEADE